MLYGGMFEDFKLFEYLITIAKKEKRHIIVTYYDVVKAYDRADLDDMCYAMYRSGIEGKLWRLMRSINDQLTAKVNTKAKRAHSNGNGRYKIIVSSSRSTSEQQRCMHTNIRNKD